MKTMPQVQKFMTPMPHSIGLKQPIRAALDLMRDHGIRHLPVQEGGELVGILTDRDVKLAGSFAELDQVSVEEVMTPDPYSVTPQSPVDQVVLEMAAHKYGCALVKQENGKLVGIFTSTDALRVLGETLQSQHKSH